MNDRVSFRIQNRHANHSFRYARIWKEIEEIDDKKKKKLFQNRRGQKPYSVKSNEDVCVLWNFAFQEGRTIKAIKLDTIAKDLLEKSTCLLK